MFSSRFVGLFFSFLLLLLPLVAGGAKEPAKLKKLVIATDAAWPPMEFLNQNKEIVGLNPDMMRAITQVTGVEIELRNTAWDGIFAGLANGSYDAVSSSVTITEERSKTMDFSTPYLNCGQVIVVLKDNQIISKMSDLYGALVGAQIGTTGAIEAAKHPQIKLKNYDEVGLAVEDLANGNLSAVVMDVPVAANYVLTNKNYQEKLKIASEVLTQEYYGVAVKKGNQAVLDVINKGIEQLEKSGKLAEIRQRWVG